MSAIEQLQVFQSMNSSPNARLERCAELGDGLSAAMWSNRHDARDYLSPDHHTLSCYLAGGTGTFRRGAPGAKGAPDKLCIMPAGEEASWIVNGDIRLAHLYFSPERCALGCVQLLDRERVIQVAVEPVVAQNARIPQVQMTVDDAHAPILTQHRGDIRSMAMMCAWLSPTRRFRRSRR